jgi:hypothetical protein
MQKGLGEGEGGGVLWWIFSHNPKKTVNSKRKHGKTTKANSGKKVHRKSPLGKNNNNHQIEPNAPYQNSNTICAHEIIVSHIFHMAQIFPASSQ